jgi:hypothetical protein
MLIYIILLIISSINLFLYDTEIIILEKENNLNKEVIIEKILEIEEIKEIMIYAG